MKLFALLFIVAGIACIVIGTSMVYDGVISKTWQKIPAKMLESKVGSKLRKNKNRYEVDVLYQYQVNGTTYESTRLSYSGYGTGTSRHDAERASGEFPKDRTVTAYVHPKDPATAVLKPGTSISACLVPLLGLLFTGGSIWLFFPSKKKAPPAVSTT